MIEKIFIPTVNRVDNQIAYNNLPCQLQSKVVMVVQAWEREQYKYDCEYLVLPDTQEYHFSDYYCLPKTRKFIYEHGKNMKYCVLDDDVTFGRRNAKYFGETSNMEKSRRKSTHEDIIEMFSLYDSWLDDVTVCGCSHVQNPPGNKKFRNNGSLCSALWINGTHFKHILHELDITSVRVMEDTCFLLGLLTRGYANRVSEEFVFYNESIIKRAMPSTIWDNQKKFRRIAIIYIFRTCFLGYLKLSMIQMEIEFLVGIENMENLASSGAKHSRAPFLNHH